MSRDVLPAGALGRAPRTSLARALGVVLVIATGVVLGLQYLTPNSRVLGVLAALAVIGVAWRIDMISGIGLLVLTLPYPRGTTFGNTNFALILLLLVLWLLRVALRQAPAPRRTPLDTPLLAMLIAWIVSFYNLGGAADVLPAFQNTTIFLTGILVFYLIVSNVRTEGQLRRLHAFQLISLTTVCLLGLYELSHPGARLIPGWIEFPINPGEQFSQRNVRISGPFFDYELLSEYTAISLLLVVFWLVRARQLLERLALGALFVLTVLVLFSTVTRGAIVSLAVALLYLTWEMRRRIRVVPFTLLVTAVIAGFLAMDYYVANFTRSGDVLSRLMGTEITGFVPDTRKAAWQDGWDRWMLHPVLGHGPYYSPTIGLHTYLWPHNGYLLIANYVGVIGLAFFLWAMVQLWRSTRPVVDSLNDPGYARSYQLVARTQLILFLVDQTKIDFLRNSVYQFQVWLYFAAWTAGYLVLRAAGPRTGAR